METEGRLRIADVLVGIRDPRQAKKVDHDLVELLVVAVCAVLAGADDFVEIEQWAKEKLDWLRRYLRLANGIPSHDTFGRVFAAIDGQAFGAAFRRWVSSVVPALAKDEVVSIDGKTSRRSGKLGATPLHLVSAFAAGAGLVLGQQATAEKSNEKTAIPELLATLALEGCIVTIDAMGTQPNIAQAIRDRGADYILSVKDNQPTLAESVAEFFEAFQGAPGKTAHTFDEVVEKDHGRIEVRRCYAFDQIDCLHAPQRWPDLASFAVIASQRTIKGKTTLEYRFYISSLPADAARLNRSIRQHWRVENSLHYGAWTSSLATTGCAREPTTPLTTSPSCAISFSTSSASPLPNARAASRFNALSRQLPTPIALKSAVLYKIHAIALRSSPSSSVPSMSSAIIHGLVPRGAAALAGFPCGASPTASFIRSSRTKSGP